MIPFAPAFPAEAPGESPTMKYAFFVASFALALMMTGCTASSGLNVPCSLPKKIDGGTVVPITEREVQESLNSGSGATRDFVAFGAVDCEDSVCVRDSSFPKGTKLDDPALGYCSRECAPGITCPSDDSALDSRGDTRMACRPLLLTREALQAIAASGKTLGVQEPYFCARGGLPDAGR